MIAAIGGLIMLDHMRKTEEWVAIKEKAYAETWFFGADFDTWISDDERRKKYEKGEKLLNKEQRTMPKWYYRIMGW